MPSFDITCGFDMQEMDNAVNMVKRDILNRYDFKGSSSSITLSKSDNNITITGDNDYHIDTIFDMLQNRAVSRSLSLKAFKAGNKESATGMTIRMKVELISGMTKETGKEINIFIKNLKLKVNSQLQGEHVRVTGKKIDDLQNVINEIKSSNLDYPMQFVNMK